MNSSKMIQYIGNKPRKKDTVAGTGTIWSGPGDVQLVEHGPAVKLLEHPDVWQEAIASDPEPSMPTTVVPLVPAAPAAPPIAEGQGSGQGEGDAMVPNVKAAVLALDRENPEHFTDKGRPRLEAVRETVPDATIQALNTAWKEIEG